VRATHYYPPPRPQRNEIINLPRFSSLPNLISQVLINGFDVDFAEHLGYLIRLGQIVLLSLLGKTVRFGGVGMATWRQKFESLSAVEREEIGKWKGGANNTQVLRQAMEAVSEFLRQYEQADFPDRDQDMPY
jgi:hypothetical protein